MSSADNSKKPATHSPSPVDKQIHIGVQRYFEVSLLLMLGTSFVTLASTRKLDFVSTVVVSACLLVKLWSYVRGVDYSFGPRLITRLSVFYMFFYVLDFLIFTPGPGFIDHMLAATVHLVLFTTVIKVFSARTYRDYAYLSTLSFLMMLSSAILTVGTGYLIGFVLYMLFAISTFISYEIKRSAERARRPPEGPYPDPARNRSALEKSLTSTTLGLAGGIVVLSAVLFFVIPRYRTGYLTGIGMERENITGFSATVNMGDLGKILQSNAVVMRVVPENDPREFRGLKWRGIGLTSFDGKRWFNDNTERTVLSPIGYLPGFVQRFQAPKESEWLSPAPRVVRYRVLLSPLSTDVLFAAPAAEDLSGRFRFLTVDQTGSMHNPQHDYSPVGYEAVSDVSRPSVAALRRASPQLPESIRLLYLRLPDRFDPRVAELARSITASAGNNYDRALAIESYLRDHYTYSLNPSGIRPSDPVGSFLFDSKQGNCEFFAAAMAVMARAVGLPSRLVNGFQTGSFNRLGGDYVIRARDAHSWVEIYFTGFGWVTFDPTPADPNAARNEAWSVFGEYLDAINLFWDNWVINYDFGRQLQLARTMEQDSSRFQREFERQSGNLRKRGVRLAFAAEAWLMSHKIILFLFMLAVLGFLIAEEKSYSLAELRYLWAWKFTRGDRALDPREAVLTYQRFLRVVGKKGFRKKEFQTPLEFAESFAASPLGRGVEEFTRLYNSFRFGQAAISISRLRRLLEEMERS